MRKNEVIIILLSIMIGFCILPFRINAIENEPVSVSPEEEYEELKTVESPKIVEFGKLKKVKTLLVEQKVLEFSGVALPESDVSLFIAGSELSISEAKTDLSGKWSCFFEDRLEVGEYVVYAVATSDGIDSAHSNYVAFRLDKDFESRV